MQACTQLRAHSHCLYLNKCCELNQRFLRDWHGIDQTIIDNAIDEWHGRLRACMMYVGMYMDKCTFIVLTCVVFELRRNYTVYIFSATIFQTNEEDLESQCNRVIMLITCDASADYSDAVTENNWPGRKVWNFLTFVFFSSPLSESALLIFLWLPQNWECESLSQLNDNHNHEPMSRATLGPVWRSKVRDHKTTLCSDRKCNAVSVYHRPLKYRVLHKNSRQFLHMMNSEPFVAE